MANKMVSLSTDEIKELLVMIQTSGKVHDELSRISRKLEKATQRIKVRSAKQKGLNLQKWVCEEISEMTGIEYDQSSDQSEISSRPSGQHGTDVILRGEALKQFPYSVECKSSESLNLVETIDQSKANVVKGTDWLIVHRRKAIPDPIVIMDWKTFKKLLRK